MDRTDLTFFDPKVDWTAIERALPHWSQAGCICFVTWRLGDSLPADALVRIDREIDALLKNEGLDPKG
ncbi:MAG: hypothetical protein KDA69_14180, partial [Planctomycetaceae bacterium]|nr:hypothetical protein [Planctomycetaceae bacterium]